MSDERLAAPAQARAEKPAGSYLACAVSDLAEGQCRSFTLAQEEALEPIEGFIVCKGGRVYAYRNACPHLNINLNWRPDGFLDIGGRHILCALHGALFNIDDGLCVSGPCFGRRLEKLAVRVEEGWAWITL
jgi:nitrite reductase/ring-hydroxylating ferredoxin subunit